ncbi:MAG: hypothetical protein AAGG81_06395 [Chlamydiota bacterium]
MTSVVTNKPILVESSDGLEQLARNEFVLFKFKRYEILQKELIEIDSDWFFAHVETSIEYGFLDASEDTASVYLNPLAKSNTISGKRLYLGDYLVNPKVERSIQYRRPTKQEEQRVRKMIKNNSAYFYDTSHKVQKFSPERSKSESVQKVYHTSKSLHPMMF